MTIVNDADDADDTMECMLNMMKVIDSDDVVNGSTFLFRWRRTVMTIRPNPNSQKQMDPAHEIPLRTKHAESEPQRVRLPLSSERL